MSAQVCISSWPLNTGSPPPPPPPPPPPWCTHIHTRGLQRVHAFPSMNTVFTDAICRILCLRRRRTYHWPAIAITHCASVFRIVAGTLSAFHARTTTTPSLPFSLLTRNTSIVLSSFVPVFFFFFYFFHTSFDRSGNEHSLNSCTVSFFEIVGGCCWANDFFRGYSEYSFFPESPIF